MPLDNPSKKKRRTMNDNSASSSNPTRRQQTSHLKHGTMRGSRECNVVEISSETWALVRAKPSLEIEFILSLRSNGIAEKIRQGGAMSDQKKVQGQGGIFPDFMITQRTDVDGNIFCLVIPRFMPNPRWVANAWAIHSEDADAGTSCFREQGHANGPERVPQRLHQKVIGQVTE